MFSAPPSTATPVPAVENFHVARLMPLAAALPAAVMHTSLNAPTPEKWLSSLRQQTPRFKRNVGGLIGDVELSTGARESARHRARFACPCG